MAATARVRLGPVVPVGVAVLAWWAVVGLTRLAHQHGFNVPEWAGAAPLPLVVVVGLAVAAVTARFLEVPGAFWALAVSAAALPLATTSSDFFVKALMLLGLAYVGAGQLGQSVGAAERFAGVLPEMRRKAAVPSAPLSTEASASTTKAEALEEPAPPALLADPGPELLARLRDAEREIGRRMIGQEHAVEVVAHALRRAGSGLSDPGRPLGSFLFLGPTGVGKTELARSQADFLFGDEKAMVRLDMSEFYAEHTAARLTGSPPGYKDSEAGGQLTEPVRKRPYSVVLLDEIEKAHPLVLDVLLQVLDEGRLTDARGNVVDFTKTIIVCTSNLSEEALAREMRPELRNRFDEIVWFRALTPAELERIADIQLGRLRERLSRRDIDVVLTSEAKQLIVAAGYDPAMGARPLKRAIQRLVENPLAEMIVSGAVGDGATVIAERDGDRLSLAIAGGR